MSATPFVDRATLSEVAVVRFARRVDEGMSVPDAYRTTLVDLRVDADAQMLEALQGAEDALVAVLEADRPVFR